MKVFLLLYCQGCIDRKVVYRVPAPLEAHRYAEVKVERPSGKQPCNHAENWAEKSGFWDIRPVEADGRSIVLDTIKPESDKSKSCDPITSKAASKVNNWTDSTMLRNCKTSL